MLTYATTGFGTLDRFFLWSEFVITVHSYLDIYDFTEKWYKSLVLMTYEFVYLLKAFRELVHSWERKKYKQPRN